MSELLVRAARGEWTHRPPVWMMRQAGRYLPEYRDVRESLSFREAISSPAVATEISLQPWERFRPDGVVMYSDILTALEPLGFDYHIESGVGPVIENSVCGPSDVDRQRSSVENELGFVGELLERLARTLQDQAAVIGFVGGPFTLACYAVEGTPSKTFMALRRLRAKHSAAFHSLLEVITDVLEDFIRFQIDHGADVIQIFDTYAGLLGPSAYREELMPLHGRLVDAANVPSIIFARNLGGHLDLLADSGADVIGLDWTVDMASARASLGDRPVQGNLDPSRLYASPDVVRTETRAIIDEAGPTGHILNLGHGVDKDTPLESVQAFFETAQSIDRTD